MWRRGVVRAGLAVALVGMVMGFGQATAAADLIDAHCSISPTDSFTETGNGREAHTFTVQNTGTLTQALVLINKLNSGDFQLQILATDSAGTPVNGILASTTVPNASVLPGFNNVVGNFGPGLAVHGGQRLALVITRPGGGNYDIPNRTDDPCPGNLFFANNQSDTFNPEPPGYDINFQTMVKPSNDFTIGGVKGKTLTLTVPGKGTIAVADAKFVRSADAVTAKAKKLLKSVKASASGPGPVSVRLGLTKTAQQLLRKKGKLKARAAITYTPIGGDPNTQRTKLRFKRR